MKDDPGSSGLTVERKFFKSNGEPANMEDLRCGDLVVVDIKVSSAEKRTLSDLVVEDLFAGAFEPVHGDLDPAVWGASGAEWVMRKDARDDRMLVFSKKFTLEAGNEVQFRYPVRVVSAGEFVLPGTALEGMYNPRSQVPPRCWSHRGSPLTGLTKAQTSIPAESSCATPPGR